jgi:hypothetical protein
MAEPQWIYGDPAALNIYSCDNCDNAECNCGEEDPDRMYDEMMGG